MRTSGNDRVNDHQKENENDQNAVRILTSAARNTEDPLTRKHAIYLLGKTGDPIFTPILIQALYDQEKAVRSQAALALFMIGTPVIPDVIDILHDKDWKVRYRAAEVLGMIKNDKAVVPLIEALYDQKDHVRYMAAKSLGMIGNPSALEPLRNCRSDENPYVRKRVDETIAAIDGYNASA